MLFSVVIPVFNRGHLLSETLRAVADQRFRDYELIVVDDCSTDNTQDLLRSWPGHLRVLRMERNRGPGAARNRGIEAAQGRYVAFLDSDDYWFPWTLDVFARSIQAAGNPAIVGGAIVEFGSQEDMRDIRECNLEVRRFDDYLSSSEFPFYVGSGTGVVSRSAIGGTRFLEDRLNGEDHDFVLRLGTAAGFVRIISPVTLGWRRHVESETGDGASTAAGMLRLVACEEGGVYPGGSGRAKDRRRVLARHVRPIAIAELKSGQLSSAWGLFARTATWNATAGHWRYLIAFPVLFLWTAVTHFATGRKGLISRNKEGGL